MGGYLFILQFWLYAIILFKEISSISYLKKDFFLSFVAMHAGITIILHCQSKYFEYVEFFFFFKNSILLKPMMFISWIQFGNLLFQVRSTI